MNSHKKHGLKLAAVLVLVAFVLVPQGRAQQSSAYKGKFKLPEPVNWQGKTLPRGEYTFSVSSTSYPARLILQGPKGTVVILASGRSDDSSVHQSALTIELRGGKRFVAELSLNDPHVALRYWIPSIPKNEPALLAERTEHILIASAGKASSSLVSVDKSNPDSSPIPYCAVIGMTPDQDARSKAERRKKNEGMLGSE